MKMINEFDIQDMNPNYNLTPEEILHDDRAYLLDLELEALSVEMGWGSYQSPEFKASMKLK
jgi:hypothetical protein